MKLHISPPAETLGREFFADLTDAPAEVVRDEEPTRKSGLFEAATLVLALPAATLATAQLSELLERRKLSRALTRLRSELEKNAAEAIIETASGQMLDLRRTPIVRVIELLRARS